jgi:hypothetical protein
MKKLRYLFGFIYGSILSYILYTPVIPIIGFLSVIENSIKKPGFFNKITLPIGYLLISPVLVLLNSIFSIPLSLATGTDIANNFATYGWRSGLTFPFKYYYAAILSGKFGLNVVNMEDLKTTGGLRVEERIHSTAETMGRNITAGIMKSFKEPNENKSEKKSSAAQLDKNVLLTIVNYGFDEERLTSNRFTSREIKEQETLLTAEGQNATTKTINAAVSRASQMGYCERFSHFIHTLFKRKQLPQQTSDVLDSKCENMHIIKEPLIKR